MNEKRQFTVRFIESKQDICGCCWNWHEVDDYHLTIREAIEWAKIKSTDSPYPTYIYKKKDLLAQYEDGRRQK